MEENNIPPFGIEKSSPLGSGKTISAELKALLDKSKKIKTYKLPLIDRLAKYRPVLKFVYAGAITAALSIPLIMAFSNLWYIYLLLLPVFIWFLLAVINLFRFGYYQTKYELWCEAEADNPVHTEIDGGAPGTGKSLYQNNSKYQQSKGSWYRTQEEMWYLMSKILKEEKLNDYDKEIYDAYKFYIENNGIPCMSGNTPVYSKEYRRYCYKATLAHLKQEEPVPYRMCTFLDELGGFIPQELYVDKWKNENKSLEIEEMGKFSRQHREWRWSGGEQNPNNVYKGVRNVVGDIKVMNGCKKIMQPIFLNWFYNKVMERLVSRMNLKDLWIQPLMKFIRKYKNLCGYYKITYTSKNTETGGSQVVVVLNQKEKKVFIPRAMPIEYLTRVFSVAYRCKDEILRMKVFEKLELDREEAMTMLRAENFKKT